MPTIRAIGTPDHDDKDATYYSALQIGTGLSKRSIGCLQYCLFHEPNTGMKQVGKVHSMWWCKTQHEYQFEVQPFAYVPPSQRLVANAPDRLVELYAQTDTTELPATALVDRIRTKVCWIPPGTDDVPGYVETAKKEHAEADSDDSDASDDEDGDDVLLPQTFFYSKTLQRGDRGARTIVEAMPPEFVDLWGAYTSATNLTRSGRRAYWKHEFAAWVLKTFVAPILSTIAPHQPPDRTFLAIEEQTYRISNATKRNRQDDGLRIRWPDESALRTLTDAQNSALHNVAAFLDTMWELRTSKADVDTVYATCLGLTEQRVLP